MTVPGWARVPWEVLRALGPMVVIEISLRASDLPATCRRLRVGCDLDNPAPPAAELAVLPRQTRPGSPAASRTGTSHGSIPTSTADMASTRAGCR